MTAHIPSHLPLIPCSTGSYLQGRTEFHNNSYWIPSHTRLRLFHRHSRPAQPRQLSRHNTSLAARGRTAPRTRTPWTGHSCYRGCPHNRHYLAPPLYPAEILGNKHGLKELGRSHHSSTDSRPVVYGMCFRNTRQRLGSFADSLRHNRSLMGHVGEEHHCNTPRKKLRRYSYYHMQVEQIFLHVWWTISVKIF